MSSLNKLAWRVFGGAAVREQTVSVGRVKLPSASVKVNKLRVPSLEELDLRVRVGRDLLEVPAMPDVGRTTTLQPLITRVLTEVGGPLAKPTVLPAAAEPLVSEIRPEGTVALPVEYHELLVKLGTPAVHGKVLVKPPADEERTQPDPLDLPPTIRPPIRRPLSTGEPYMAEDLYALLLPPAADLVDLSFEWPSDLYPFQVEGVEFLSHRRHALLADEMGLGKTIEAIGAIRVLMKAGWLRQVLVVCPASIKTNWAAEFRKWAPELSCQVVAGDRGDRRRCWRKPCHVLIVNYMSLIRDADYDYCSARKYDLVVLDEAQRIKNAGTKTAQTTKALERASSWSLTGTPVENSADDIRSIFDFVHPHLGLGHTAFADIPHRIEPYFLRRRKQDVLHELPPKRMVDRWLSLSSAQRAAYDEAETQGIAYLRDLGQAITITHVFALITRLKQICNFDPRTEQSCKLEYLREVLDEIAAAGQKALVFSQFTQTLEFLRGELSDLTPVAYHGGMSPTQKDAAVVEFTDSVDRPLMLISLKAGGLGLNLQAASWVFHYDRWWTPAAERQAEDRAHRIGQTATVMVERLMCEDTIEERIHNIQQRKQEIIDSIVERDYEEAIERLSTEEMFEAIGLEPELAEFTKRRLP